MTLAEIGRDGAPGIVDGYRTASAARPSGPRLSGDEFLGADGTVRTSWRRLADTVELLGTEGMQARGEQVRRLLEDDGVTYGTSTDAGAAPGRWQLDPLPVILGSQEWAELSPGLIQRAELLDRLLADLYGPRDLLKRGLVPPEVVLGHAGFIRQCDGIRLPGPSQLVMASTDLVRGADLAVANLEMPITAHRRRFAPYKRWRYHTDPRAATALAWAGEKPSAAA